MNSVLRRCRDADSIVREAAAEVAGMLAATAVVAAKEAGAASVGPMMMRPALEALSDHGMVCPLEIVPPRSQHSL